MFRDFMLMAQSLSHDYYNFDIDLNHDSQWYKKYTSHKHRVKRSKNKKEKRKMK